MPKHNIIIKFYLMPNSAQQLGVEQMKKRKRKTSFLPHTHPKRTLLPTPACPAPSSYVVSWHSTTRTCAVLVIVATAMSAVLRLLFAEVVSFILALIHVVLHRRGTPRSRLQVVYQRPPQQPSSSQAPAPSPSPAEHQHQQKLVAGFGGGGFCVCGGGGHLLYTLLLLCDAESLENKQQGMYQRLSTILTTITS